MANEQKPIKGYRPPPKPEDLWGDQIGLNTCPVLRWKCSPARWACLRTGRETGVVAQLPWHMKRGP